MNRYEKTINKVIETINEGVVLMTSEEELEYKQRVVKDLNNWVKYFKKNFCK
jgi:hypothetical protein